MNTVLCKWCRREAASGHYEDYIRRGGENPACLSTTRRRDRVVQTGGAEELLRNDENASCMETKNRQKRGDRNSLNSPESDDDL